MHFHILSKDSAGESKKQYYVKEAHELCTSDVKLETTLEATSKAHCYSIQEWHHPVLTYTSTQYKRNSWFPDVGQFTLTTLLAFTTLLASSVSDTSISLFDAEMQLFRMHLK